MSIEAYGRVWKYSRARGTARVVLLAIADHANAEGGNAYPSVRRIAEMANVCQRSVQNALASLRESGELVAVARHRSGTTIYRLSLGNQEADTGRREAGPPTHEVCCREGVHTTARGPRRELRPNRQRTS